MFIHLFNQYVLNANFVLEAVDKKKIIIMKQNACVHVTV